ncbi:Cbb3-type cytochrome c oxidase subunit CcoP2 [Gammaproteobacteria bacterium]
MSNAISWWIGIVSVLNMLACVWLIWWSNLKQDHEMAQDQSSHHRWDGIEEYNHPLPRWWLYLFYVTIVFGLAYLLLYPGFGHFRGLLDWSQEGQYQQEMQAIQQDYGPLFDQYARMEIPAMIKDPQAMKMGKRLFLNYCAACHAADAKGNKGYPNLTDNDWLWGGDPDSIKATITQGRGVGKTDRMPAQQGKLSDSEIDQVAHYVKSLSGGKVDAALASAGKALFKTEQDAMATYLQGMYTPLSDDKPKDQGGKGVCMDCHGPEGKGMTTLGAPNLTDSIWLYGGTLASIKETITHGRSGVMPAFGDLLDKAKVNLLAGYVYGLSHQ